MSELTQEELTEYNLFVQELQHLLNKYKVNMFASCDGECICLQDVDYSQVVHQNICKGGSYYNKDHVYYEIVTEGLSE
jgi:hypothetical protein